MTKSEAIKEIEEYLRDADKAIGEDEEYIRGWKSALIVAREIMYNINEKNEASYDTSGRSGGVKNEKASNSCS